MSGIPEVRTDFNERSGAYVLCLEEHVPSECSPGARLLLVDGDGNQCLGHLSRIRSGVAYVMPLWNTWKSAGSVVDGVGANDNTKEPNG